MSRTQIIHKASAARRQGFSLVSILLLVPLFLAAPTACELSGDDGQLTMLLYYTSPGSGDLRLDPPTVGEAPGNITDYRICVSAEDMEQAICMNFKRDDHATGAKMGDLPVGENRKVVFQGYDAESEYVVRWCGEQEGISIKHRATTSVSMFISSCSNFTSVRNSMIIQRAMHSATLLPDGRVVLVGGFTEVGSQEDCPGGYCRDLVATSKIDIYDSSTGSFGASTGLELLHPRAAHTATLLDDGRILLVGGVGLARWRVSFDNGPQPMLENDPVNVDDPAAMSAELLDLENRSVTEIPLDPASPRLLHAAVTLDSGTIVLGGLTPASNQALATVARYSGGSEPWEELPDELLGVPRQGMVVVPLDDGRFFVWGGNHAQAEADPGEFAILLEDKAEGLVATQPAFVSNEQSLDGLPSFYSAGTRLGENLVLISGGAIVDQVYKPAMDEWPEMLAALRVLDLTADAEQLVDITWTRMKTSRAMHTSTIMDRGAMAGMVMLAGGLSEYNRADRRFLPTYSVEFFSLEDEGTSEMKVEGWPVVLAEARAGHTATCLLDGSVLVTGGFTSGNESFAITDSAEVFNPASRALRIE